MMSATPSTPPTIVLCAFEASREMALKEFDRRGVTLSESAETLLFSPSFLDGVKRATEGEGGE